RAGMKHFEPITFDYSKCRQETEQLKGLLESSPSLGERKHILPFFRKRPQLSALCGIFNSNINRPDRVAWEYELFGDFHCDMVVGDSVTRAYCFIEFEDA